MGEALDEGSWGCRLEEDRRWLTPEKSNVESEIVGSSSSSAGVKGIGVETSLYKEWER